MADKEHPPEEHGSLATPPWVWRYHASMFRELTSEHPVEINLANMKAAITAGADANEL